MQSHRAIVALVGLGTLAACAKDAGTSKKPSALSLDVRLDPTQVRAGRVTKPSELVGGLTQKGRAGDYKIYNAKIAVIIAQAGDARGYHPYGGTILDADVIRPEGQAGNSHFGEVINAFDLAVMKPSRVEVISDGSNGKEARIRFYGDEAVMPLFDSIFSNLFEATVFDLGWNIDYVLEPSSDALRIEHSATNRSKASVEIGLPIVAFFYGAGAPPFMPGYGFTPPSANGFGDYYGAVGDEVSYLYGRSDGKISVIITNSGVVIAGVGEGFKLRAHESATVTQHLVVGDGDLSRTQESWRRLVRGSPGQPVSGRVVDTSGAPVAGARVHITLATPSDPGRDYVTFGRTGPDGRFMLSLEPGSYRAVVAAGTYLVGEPTPLQVAGAPVTNLELSVGKPGTLRYRVVDAQDRLLPVKLSIRPEGRPVQQLAPRFGESNQAYGLLSTVFAVKGQGEVELPRGDYTVFVSRGSEYEIAEERVTILPAASATLEARLSRSVRTSGWLSTDTHVHAQLSPDSTDLYPMKVSSMVTEGLQIPVSTEHEAIGDFNPAIRALGVEAWMQGIVGSEITTFTYGHFNAFPLIPDPTKAGNGRIDWYGKRPAETFAAIRANPGKPFLQVNHPRSVSIGGYLSAMGFDRASYSFHRPQDFSYDFDGLEVANGCDVPFIEAETMADWFAFLNNGHRIYATGATDNHHASNGEMGYPRTYVRMPTDDPHLAQIEDMRASFMAGRLVVSCGPFLEAKLGHAEIGEIVPVDGDRIAITVRVAAPSWMSVDQLEVVVNGAVVTTVPIPPSPGAERFMGTVTAPVAAGRDGWAIIRVRGREAHGVWARNRPSYAFTNPFFLDGDHDGAWTMR